MTAAPPPPAPPAAPRRWAAHRCGYRGNAFMLAVGRRVLWLGYVFVCCAAVWFCIAHRAARRASSRYLQRVRPRRPAPLRWLDTYRHMVTFGKLLLDRAVMLADAGHGFRVTIDGAENFHTAVAAGRGMVLLTAHFGCAEAAAPALDVLPGAPPLSVVMYQDPHAPTEQFHRRTRRALRDVTIISTTDPVGAGLKVMAALKRGEAVALRADRALDGRTIDADLLGGPVPLPAGPFLAAVLTGAPILQVHAVRVGYRRYRIILLPPRTYHGPDRDALVAQAAADFARDLTPLLQRYPLQWSNFHDLWQ